MNNDEVIDSMAAAHDARIRDEAFERGVAIGRAEAVGALEHIDRLWCCVCLFIRDDKRPEGWEDNALTMINGSLICVDHIDFAGFNQPLSDYWTYKRNRKT